MVKWLHDCITSAILTAQSPECERKTFRSKIGIGMRAAAWTRQRSTESFWCLIYLLATRISPGFCIRLHSFFSSCIFKAAAAVVGSGVLLSSVHVVAAVVTNINIVDNSFFFCRRNIINNFSVFFFFLLGPGIWLSKSNFVENCFPQQQRLIYVNKRVRAQRLDRPVGSPQTIQFNILFASHCTWLGEEY